MSTASRQHAHRHSQPHGLHASNAVFPLPARLAAQHEKRPRFEIELVFHASTVPAEVHARGRQERQRRDEVAERRGVGVPPDARSGRVPPDDDLLDLFRRNLGMLSNPISKPSEPRGQGRRAPKSAPRREIVPAEAEDGARRGLTSHHLEGHPPGKAPMAATRSRSWRSSMNSGVTMRPAST